MKKLTALLLTFALTFACVGCGSKAEEAEVKSEGVMTYEEYMAAELETEVVIEAYVQAKQSWWEDKATVYTQDQDGAYFLYEMACSEEDYAKLVPGTKIRVNGYKAEWAGEVEIVEIVFVTVLVAGQGAAGMIVEMMRQRIAVVEFFCTAGSNGNGPGCDGQGAAVDYDLVALNGNIPVLPVQDRD